MWERAIVLPARQTGAVWVRRAHPGFARVVLGVGVQVRVRDRVRLSTCARVRVSVRVGLGRLATKREQSEQQNVDRSRRQKWQAAVSSTGHKRRSSTRSPEPILHRRAEREDAHFHSFLKRDCRGPTPQVLIVLPSFFVSRGLSCALLRFDEVKR